MGLPLTTILSNAHAAEALADGSYFFGLTREIRSALSAPVNQSEPFKLIHSPRD